MGVAFVPNYPQAVSSRLNKRLKLAPSKTLGKCPFVTQKADVKSLSPVGPLPCGSLIHHAVIAWAHSPLGL